MKDVVLRVSRTKHVRVNGTFLLLEATCRGAAQQPGLDVPRSSEVAAGKAG